MSLPIKEIKPKNARTKRYLENKGPQNVENPRTTLFLKYTTTSEVLQLVLKDLHSLKRPLCIKFDKKNSIHPFEDASSLEFFADKNDASLMVYGSHSKKRPHALTLVRLFDFKVLEMLELLVDADSFRSLSQFKNAKAAVGLKPLLAFSGSAFESPTANAYTQARSIFLDLFKGPDVTNVDVEGLQYMIHFSVDEEENESVKPQIHMRCYLIKTKKGGGVKVKVDVEEMGPRIDFRVGRTREADPDMWKAAMKKPKMLEVSKVVLGEERHNLTLLQAKTKKNIETDTIGDKVGRIHMGRQDLSQLQTRKMKGLKRSRDVVDNNFDDVEGAASENGGVSLTSGKKAKL
ncbi:hypothetical protein DOTSEDRAFT_30348 [Dothistroma septosporum NZE10]|uniref:Ribosome production factor 2 homolog n=1 Tax=Dothistroma septosporum (strain NZE10 / CBS 128990) TaxID=675120 RepID=N1Q176_DOTSN|nr:hypothetical protein DOTSEDRAFT_30348 [Dothistroma septosporum NZE10]